MAGAILEQIDGVMRAAEKEVNVIVLRVDGTLAEAIIDHRKIGLLLSGGTPTVVGAIPSLGVAALAKSGAKGRINAHTLPDEIFEQNIKGDIVLLRTANDEVGTPVDFVKKDYDEWVQQGRPVDGSEDESEPEVDLGTLTVDQLRELCASQELPTTGTKQVLIDRLVKSADAHPDSSGSDEGKGSEESEQEESEDDEEKPVHRASAPAKRSAPPAERGAERKARR